MSSTVRNLAALVIKCNTQPGWISTILVLILMAGLSVWDSRSPFEGVGWLLMLWWLTILGTSAGTGAFSSDLKNDNIRFLEYLPIRRWQIWLADFADGLFWLGLFIVAAVWWRTLHWTPPDPNAFSRDPLPIILFRGRWTLPVGCAALGFCAFASAAYSRLAIERDSTAIFRAFSDAVAIVFMIWLIPVSLGLTPALDELAIPLALIGALYTLAGFVTFMYTPREWGRWKRWWLIRLPTLLILLICTFAIIALMCQHWARFDSIDLEDVTVEPRADLGEKALLTFHSRRSGAHLLTLDTQSGATHYLGRGLGYKSGRGDTLTLATAFRPGTPIPSPGTVPVAADGSIQWHHHLPDQFTFEGAPWRRQRVIWPTNRQHVAFTASPRGSASYYLCLADPSGNVARRIETESGSWLELSGDRFVFPRPDPSEDRTARWPPREFFVYHSATGDITELKLPEPMLACNADFTHALCVRAATRELILVDLASGQSRTLLTASQTQPDEADEYPDRWWWQPSVIDNSGGTLYFGQCTIEVDAGMSQAAWSVRRGARNLPDGLNWIHFASGEIRELMSAAELRRSTDGSPIDPSFLSVAGFTSAGDALVYQNSVELVRVSVPDGTRTVVARSDPGERYPAWTLSPDRRRVLRAQSEPADKEVGRRARYHMRYELWDAGVSRPVADGESVNVRWHDNQHLLLSQAGKVWLIHADTLERRQIYPKPD
jgi:hypothetical protein